ncbi:aminotransferase class IV [Streptomyces sp. Z26]|uniref:aminotransferase class IV n=1 Tax=Streptomyces sp. Z26 TaxID=2500177 RepID=UPI000EF13B2F|nr:aminotransferase class IV [Streptomyces sp. Z26]RLL66667.1 aminotransferase [Streptomyces sp. Z26]
MVTLDGRPVSADDLAALALTNMGHFTSLRVEGDGSVRGLALHMERLVRDCSAVWNTALDTGRVRAYVRQALEGRSLPCVVRVTVHDPGVDLGRPADARAPRVFVSVREAGPPAAEPLRVRSVVYERDLPEVKHTGLFGALHARRTAQRVGADDALFVGRDRLVSEGPTWNVAFVDHDGTVVWPDARVLPGVTRALLRPYGTHRVSPVTPERAKGMAAAFVTNTAVGVRALAAIDDTAFPVDHEVVLRLREAYAALPGERLEDDGDG